MPVEQNAGGRIELYRMDGLAQVIIDARGQSGDAEGRVASGGGDDNRRVEGVTLFELAHELEPSRVRKRVGHDVEVGRTVGLCGGQERLGVGENADRIAAAHEL